MKILIVGYGFMGRALGESWKASEVASKVLAVDPMLDKPADGYFPSFDCLLSSDDATGFDLIVLAVKPGLIASVVASIPNFVCTDAIVLSVAAGITLANLESLLPAGVQVARAMPNTPIAVSAGCTGLFAGPGVDDSQRERLLQLFRSAGIAFWLRTEAEIDAVTAISGSGPAYYHLFSEALAQAAVALGLSPDVACALAANTAWGAALQQKSAPNDLQALRSAVTSPNGTTAAAITVFENQQGLRTLVREAVDAAHHRASELAQ